MAPSPSRTPSETRLRNALRFNSSLPHRVPFVPPRQPTDLPAEIDARGPSQRDAVHPSRSRTSPRQGPIVRQPQHQAILATTPEDRRSSPQTVCGHPCCNIRQNNARILLTQAFSYPPSPGVSGSRWSDVHSPAAPPKDCEDGFYRTPAQPAAPSPPAPQPGRTRPGARWPRQPTPADVAHINSIYPLTLTCTKWYNTAIIRDPCSMFSGAFYLIL